MVLTSGRGDKRKAALPLVNTPTKAGKDGPIKSQTSSRDKGMAKKTKIIRMTCGPDVHNDVPVFMVGIGFNTVPMR